MELGNNSLNFIGGFLKGGVDKRKREQEKEMNALQKQLLNIKLQTGKFKQKQLEFTQNLFNAYQTQKQTTEQKQAQTEQAGNQPTPLGESFGKKEGLLDLLSNPSVIMGMGGDVNDVMREGHNREIERQGDERINIQNRRLEYDQSKGIEKTFQQPDGTIIKWRQDPKTGQMLSTPEIISRPTPQGVDITGTSGEVSKTFINPYAPGPGIKTKPALKDFPIDEASIPLWRNKETLAPVPFGTTPSQAEKQGYVRVTSGQLDAVMSFGAVETIMEEVENKMSEFFPKEETLIGGFIGGKGRQIGAATGANIPAALFQKLIMGTLAPTIRTLGEKGNLSDTDVKRAEQLYPLLKERGQIAWGALYQLKDIIRNNKRVKLGGLGLKPIDNIVTDDEMTDILKKRKK